jgi:hypothetical protein
LESPYREPAGECTSPCRHCRHLPSLLRRLATVSGDARPDGRQPAFAPGDVARGSTPIHPMTGWPSLLPSSHARTPLGLPCGLLSLAGDVRGSPVPSPSHTNGGGALCPPVAWNAHDKEGGNPWARYSALLAQACQHLWLVVVDDVYRAFPSVRHTIHPRPVSVSVLTETSSPHGCDASRWAVGPWSGGAVRVVTFPHISVGYR